MLLLRHRGGKKKKKENASLPEKLAESFVVGDGLVVVLGEAILDVLQAPLVHQLAGRFGLLRDTRVPRIRINFRKGEIIRVITVWLLLVFISFLLLFYVNSKFVIRADLFVSIYVFKKCFVSA